MARRNGRSRGESKQTRYTDSITDVGEVQTLADIKRNDSNLFGDQPEEVSLQTDTSPFCRVRMNTYECAQR